MRHCVLFASLLCSVAGTTFAQQQAGKTQAGPTAFSSLVDPACPVAGYPSPAPSTEELRVLYFPMGINAVIKEPQSLLLHLIFEQGQGGDARTLPFHSRPDGLWEAIVALKDRQPTYAVYWVEDTKTKQSDINGGKYFDVPFCNVHGQRLDRSVMFESRSYTGILGSAGIDRPADYAKAIEVLDDYIHFPNRGQNLIGDRWRYKLLLKGDTPEARKALLTEMDKFVDDHAADGFGLVGTLNFVAYEDWIPAETIENLLQTMERLNPTDESRLFVLQARAARERDKAKQIALEREIVRKYPESSVAEVLRTELLLELSDLREREELFREIRLREPPDPMQPFFMAGIYLDANQKIPEALALLEEAEKLFDANARGNEAGVRYSELEVQQGKRRIAVAKADALVRLGRPAEALAILQPIRSEFKAGSSFYILGKALEAAGDSSGAIDAYLESVVRFSNYQERASADLDKLWRQEKMGNKRALQKRIDALVVQRFSEAKYAPHVLRHAAPEFSLAVFHGESLSSSQLRGKKVILTFWATWCPPCLSELKELENYQKSHPEIVMLAAVSESTDAKQIETVMHEKKLKSLRIGFAPSQLWDQYGVNGVPSTFVIDENGFVRIQHYGALPEVARYLDADLKAIE